MEALMSRNFMNIDPGVSSPAPSGDRAASGLIALSMTVLLALTIALTDWMSGVEVRTYTTAENQPAQTDSVQRPVQPVLGQ
jgi:hypothetical protein